ncbi:MAG: hypothetical protein V8Q42_09875 [Anaerovoracaceae bacterium]
MCREENEGHTFMLVKHIGQAMAANQRGAKIRIRSHLKLMDRFFWDDQYEIKTDHRIKGLLQEWVRKSDRMKTDIEEYKTGRKRVKKLFHIHTSILMRKRIQSALFFRRKALKNMIQMKSAGTSMAKKMSFLLK